MIRQCQSIKTLKALEDGNVWDSDEFYLFGEEFQISLIMNSDGNKDRCLFPERKQYVQCVSYGPMERS